MKESQLKKAFGQALVQARKKKGMSQQELAYQADIDRSYISNLENGIYSPTLMIIHQLCEALEIRPSELLQQMERGTKN